MLISCKSALKRQQFPDLFRFLLSKLKIVSVMRFLLVMLLGSIAFGSCNVPKETLYFKDNRKTDTSVVVTHIPPYQQSLIAPDDILAVSVSSISDFTSKDPVRIFNEGGIEYNLTPANGNQASGGANSGGSNMKGYLVDPDGYIDYPVIGKLKVAGLTLREVKTLLANRLASDYVKDPVVEVRIMNYKVTVLGEVRYPGVVIAPNHRMNVLEAIAAAGDINLSGRKDNVMVIREINGKREFASVNLNSRNAFTNPYFILKQNDIVYIQAGRAVRENSANTFVRFFLPVIATTLATASAIIAFSLMSKE